MLLSEKQKIDSGFFLFEAEQRAKTDKLEKGKLNSSKICPVRKLLQFLVVAKHQLWIKKLFDCICYYYCADIFSKNKKRMHCLMIC